MKDYHDRAKIRRKLVGSVGPGERKVVPGHTGIYSGCQATPVAGASTGSVGLKTGIKVASVNVPISSENKGFKLLKSMGWKEGEGLGKEKQGMANPVC